MNKNVWKNVLEWIHLQMEDQIPLEYFSTNSEENWILQNSSTNGK